MNKRYACTPALEHAKIKHAQIRRDSYQTVVDQTRDRLASQNIVIALKEITCDDARTGDCWSFPEGRQPGWFWEKELKRARRKPQRIDAAIWLSVDGGPMELYGLVLGKISEQKVCASMHFLAGSPNRNKELASLLPVFAVANLYLTIHANKLGCEYVALVKPIPQLVNYYKKYGFLPCQTRGGVVSRMERTL